MAAAAEASTSSQDDTNDMSPESEPVDMLQEVRTKEEGQCYVLQIHGIHVCHYIV